MDRNVIYQNDNIWQLCEITHCLTAAMFTSKVKKWKLRACQNSWNYDRPTPQCIIRAKGKNYVLLIIFPIPISLIIQFAPFISNEKMLWMPNQFSDDFPHFIPANVIMQGF